MSKKLLLTAATAMLLTTGAGAQQGTWMIYGGGSYDRVNYTENSTIYTTVNGSDPLPLVGWTANLGIGYQFSKHFTVGLLGGYGSQEEAHDNYNYPYSAGVTKYTDKLWEGGVWGRYTAWIGKHFFFYTQLSAFKYGESLEYNELSSTTVQPYTYSYPTTPEGNGINVSLFPAIGASLWNGYGVHMDIGGIGYNSYNSFTEATRHHLNITLGQQFSFGIHKIIGWKKFNKEQKEATAN